MEQEQSFKRVTQMRQLEDRERLGALSGWTILTVGCPGELPVLGSERELAFGCDCLSRTGARLSTLLHTALGRAGKLVFLVTLMHTTLDGTRGETEKAGCWSPGTLEYLLGPLCPGAASFSLGPGCLI